MGRHSSDSDDSHYRRSKKKKKHTRSDSSSSVESYSSRHSKHKRSKKASKHRHRSRSRSKGKYDRRSRSRSYDKKSRSDDRRRSRSRSRQRSHRRRSQSRSRYRRSYSRERSDTKGRSRSRSRSKPPKEKIPVVKVEPSANIPGFDNMTPAEQAQARLHLALRAAAAADRQLKAQGLLGANVKSEPAILSLAEQQNRAKAIDDIESDSFVPAAFKSTRGQQSSLTPDLNSSHDSAIFGQNSAAKNTNIGAIVCMKVESIMHPNLYVSAEEKMVRWKEKLSRMRKKIIEQGMTIS
ncbi:hypothetical protein NP493_446g01014 [Ridgeia piscesae]|uniref:Serine/Arginine-related protein 53 n=1 Tax=Ridgeia piscesae TaxID=27915 RepID=A0AAD9L0L0_RIDPI|nr:hypothetical protein NP493_446g01014 [Ridgeia piscesae]